MKRNTENLRTILEVMGLLILFLAFEHLVSARLTWLALSLWAIIWLIGIVDKLRYLGGHYRKTIRIPTVNDEFIRVSGFLLGGAITAGALAWMIFSKHHDFFQPALFVAGILLLSNAVLHVPGASVRISTHNLRLDHKHRRIPLASIKSLHIAPGRLEVHEENGRVSALSRLALDESVSNELKTFIEERIPHATVLIDHGISTDSAHSHL